jgi:hypothetical protein
LQTSIYILILVQEGRKIPDDCEKVKFTLCPREKMSGKCITGKACTHPRSTPSMRPVPFIHQYTEREEKHHAPKVE